MSAKAAPPHHYPPGFPLIQGELQLGGQPLTRIAARAGQTPFYAYDRQLISERVRLLRSRLPAGLRLNYAVKANPMAALVCHLAGLVDGLDVASAGELRLALDSGMAAAAISFAGPGKTDAELRQAVAAGVMLNVESAGELRRLARISEACGWPARVALRINPDFELKASGMRMGGGPKPFGIDAEQVPGVLQELAGCGLQFEGFHLFAGSQNLKAEAIVEAQGKSWELIRRLAEHAPCPPRCINLGGGFGIPYFPGERPLELEPVADGLARIIDECRGDFPDAYVKLELGRYLVGEAGIYVCRIIDRKESRGRTYLVTDGGMHHHLPASGNFGQVLRKNYPVAAGSCRAAEAPLETVSAVGPLCTPLDLIADQVELPHLEVGDLLVVFQSGAYGPSASPQNFLGHPSPVEILI